MKPRLLTFISLTLFFAAVFTTCKKTEENKPDYHKNISFKEYSLIGTQCQWKNLPYNNKVIIINSREELEQYITFNETAYPAVDFAKNSLLLASGKFYNGILEPIVTRFQQHSSNKYSLDIDIIASDTAEHKSWVKVLVVKKMAEDSKVKLNETFKEQELNYPIDVPFIDYSLEGTECKWIGFGGYTSKAYYVIINNKTRFDNHIHCFSETPYPPEIDFSKYSLILVCGMWKIYQSDFVSLQRIDNRNYKMTIHLAKTGVPGYGFWFVPILVHKIGDDVPIELIVEKEEL